MERSPAEVVARVGAYGRTLEEKLYHCNLAVLGGHVERSHAGSVHSVDVGVKLAEQDVDDVRVANLGGDVERAGAALVEGAVHPGAVGAADLAQGLEVAAGASAE